MPKEKRDRPTACSYCNCPISAGAALVNGLHANWFMQPVQSCPCMQSTKFISIVLTIPCISCACAVHVLPICCLRSCTCAGLHSYFLPCQQLFAVGQTQQSSQEPTHHSAAVQPCAHTCCSCSPSGHLIAFPSICSSNSFSPNIWPCISSCTSPTSHT